jgi:hypothetical protein
VVSGNQLTLTWPVAWTGGVQLQGQTNSYATNGIHTNWVTIAGTELTNSFVTTISKSNGSVFYRLLIP